MRKINLMLILLLALPASSCAVGDFADLAEPLCLDDIASAQMLLDMGERKFVVALNVHNDLAGGC